MTKAWLNRIWQLGLVSSLTIGSAITSLSFANALPEYVLAQIQPDSSLGDESSVVNSVDENSDRIDGGAIRSNNLLHSFQEFNVGEGKAVYFANPQAIENIFSRVTGNNPSQIQGLLGVLGNANLFLLNPNGIIFGENASLDVNGSFVATTAESILFENGQEFSAINPQKPILEIKVPLGLQIGNTPGAIVNQARTTIGGIPVGLIVDAGKTLSLVGGDINLNGGILNSLGGRIELGGLAVSGEVKFNQDGSLSFPNDVARADISLSKEAIVNVAATDRGEISIIANNLKLAENSKLRAGIDLFGIRGVGSPKAVAGDITINATGEIALAQESGILNQILEDNIGKAGNIDIQTSSLKLIEGSLISTGTIGKGDAGNIKIDVTDTFSADNSFILSVAAGSAEGGSGNLSITANNLNLTNSNEIRSAISDKAKGNGGDIKIKANNIFADRSIILSGVAQLAVGNAGVIEIDTSNLTLANGSLIDNSTLGKGDGGNLNIGTRNLTLTHSQISSSTNGTGNAGNINIGAIDTIYAERSIIFGGVGEKAQGSAGRIEIDTSNLTLANGSSIDTSTLGKEDAGNINIKTDKLILNNEGKLNTNTYGRGNAGGIKITATSTLSADGGAIGSTVQDNAEGNSGEIEIATGELTLNNISQINNSVSGKGNGRDIKITTTDISVDNGSFITSETFEGAEGNAGGVDINTNNLNLNNESEIVASTNGIGSGGKIKLTANNTVSVNNSNILSVLAEKGAGSAGAIEINTKKLNINNGGAISTGIQGKGDGGKIEITATDDIFVNESFIGSAVSDTAIGNGGVIELETPKLFLNNETVLSTQSRGQGNAGNIKVDADSFTLDRGSSIFASNTPSANISTTLSGGNITLQIADRLTLRNDSDISTQASSNANGGNIDITADAVVAFDDSDIFAFAQEGRGGNITLNTPAYFGYSFNPSSSRIKPSSSNNFLNGNNRADINATGAISGVVTVPDVSFIQNSLTELPENPIDTNALIANSCIARRDRGGTFTVTGAGGLPNRPGDAAVSPYPTGEVRGVESDRTSNDSTHRSWKIGDPIVEPQAAYRLADGQMVLSRECER